MNFYLTEIDNKSVIKFQLLFPMNPERVSITTGVVTEDYSVIGLGEVRIPKGNSLDVISWEGILPSESLKDAPFVKSWRNPKEIFEILNRYKKRGTKLQLMITDSPIITNVFIDKFDPVIGEVSGIKYSITFSEYKDLIVYTESEKVSMAGTAASTKRPEPPKETTSYTVKSGDTLWKIALKYLKNGSRYPEIQAANKPALNDPNKISVGQVLKIPKA